ncbi:MAG: sulfide/dihydroorotate dehydrogenase-like FAD/NAD-binding protein [Deltaproteobacteria bacterium]|nr:sulfide/dihydroorotate dehydrogenase-like FAD/NAD-binding protein [Deltaproteobacteria bacterium]
MSARVVNKKILIPGRVTEMDVDAPAVAAKALPGNFVVLRLSEKGERIPLTIADTDPEVGLVKIVYMVLGKTTALLDTLNPGDMILDFCGPLGKPTAIEKIGRVVCVGGGTGIAAMHHIAKGHARAGNEVVAVIGARSRDLLLFESELSSFCHKILVATDDGSAGHKGFVTDVLKSRLAEDPEIREVVAVGPVPMMEAVAKTTKEFGVKTIVSLNPIMVDGIGMCGACRVTVDGAVRFACVDGPEFDAHGVDFLELKRRLRAFCEDEQLSYREFCECHGQKDHRS